MPNLLVSVIVPSFNQGRFIRETIESCLAQDYRPIEVVVIDGASTDGTLDVLHSYDDVPEVRWTSERDSGVVEAVNKGFAKARGEFAGIQSSDDSYLPGAISAAMSHFVEDPGLGMVYGDCIKVDEGGRELSRYQTGPFSIEAFLSKQTIILQPATFFRLGLVKEIGGWDPRYFNADTEMWLRMIFRTRVLKIDRFMSKRSMHGEQRDKQAEKIVESYWRMMDESKDLAAAPRRLRRAAKCGKYLHALRYLSEVSEWRRVRYEWGALLAYPEVVRHRGVSSRLLPWGGALRRALTSAVRSSRRK